MLDITASTDADNLASRADTHAETLRIGVRVAPTVITDFTMTLDVTLTYAGGLEVVVAGTDGIPAPGSDSGSGSESESEDGGKGKGKKKGGLKGFFGRDAGSSSGNGYGDKKKSQDAKVPLSQDSKDPLSQYSKAPPTASTICAGVDRGAALYAWCTAFLADPAKNKALASSTRS